MLAGVVWRVHHIVCELCEPEGAKRRAFASYKGRAPSRGCCHDRGLELNDIAMGFIVGGEVLRRW
jgi:hypothetical protein